MKSSSKLIIGTFVILSVCTGTAIIAPFFNMTAEAGCLIGVIFGFLLMLAAIKLWEFLQKLVNDPHRAVVTENRYLTFRESLIYPTQIPMNIGTVWFICLISIVLLFDIQISTTAGVLLLLLPALILIGTSGFLMTKRREFVSGGMFGYKIIRGT